MDIICRTCLSYHDNLEPLFSKKLVDTDYIEIPTMLFLCTGLKVSEGDLSNTICTQCIESIIAAFKYRKLVWDSDNYLIEATKSLINTSDKEIKIEESNGHFKIEIFDESIIDIHTKRYDLSENDELSDIEYSLKDDQISSWDVVPTKEEEYQPDKSSIKELVPETPSITKTYESLDNYITIDNKSSTERPYNCTICNHTYELIAPLRKHLMLVHNICMPNSFACSKCSKTFFTEKHFKRHFENIHGSKSKNFVCELCGNAFESGSTLRDHLNRHKGVKPYKCDICSYCCVSRGDLKVHLRSHTGEKPYICHICGIGSRSSSHRGAHIKEAHSNGRLRECTICGENVKSYRAYLRHMMIHDPKQHSKCEICHKEFKFRKNLKIHMRQHGEKMFKCTVCEKAFYQKQSCKAHMKNAHDVNM